MLKISETVIATSPSAEAPAKGAPSPDPRVQGLAPVIRVPEKGASALDADRVSVQKPPSHWELAKLICLMRRDITGQD